MHLSILNEYTEIPPFLESEFMCEYQSHSHNLADAVTCTKIDLNGLVVQMLEIQVVNASLIAS